MLLLLNVIEMIVYIKHLYYGRFDDFHRLIFFHSYPNKKKLKSTLIEKNSEDYLSNKNTNSIFSWVVNSIAEINYEIFSIRPKAYS
jgi:hypothetical protein